jgi:hypothetical protein
MGASRAPTVEHPGYFANVWYQTIGYHEVFGGSGPAANTIKLLPFVLTKPIRIQALGTRVTTAAAGGKAQLAIYAHNAATRRPTGNAIVSTGDISTTSAAAVSGSVTAATLSPGIYWSALNADGATANYQSIDEIQTGLLIGSTTLSNISSGAAGDGLFLTVSQAFGTWPDLTSASFTEATGNCPIIYMQAA